MTPASEAGRDVLRHSTAHVLAQAVTRLWPGCPLRHRPAIRDGFYYDFELPGGARFTDDDLARIDAEMRAIIAEDQPFTRAEYSLRRGPRALRTTSPSRSRSSTRSRRAATDEDLAEVASASVVSTYSNSPAFTRPLPWTPRAVDGAPRALQVDARGGCVLARRRETPPAPARSTAPPGSRRRRSPRTSSSSKRRRSATTAVSGWSSTCSPFPRELGPGLAVFHPKGGIDSAGHGGVLAQPPRRGRLRVRELTPHHQVRALRDLGAPRVVRRRHVSTNGARRRAAVLLEADELPVSRADLQVAPAQLPRAAAADVRIRHGLPLREVRRRARSDARARHDPGRRAHLLHPRADGRRARDPARLRARALRDFGLNDFYLELSTRPEGKAVGSDEEWAEARTHARHGRSWRGSRTRDGRGRRRLLRPQDLGPGA